MSEKEVPLNAESNSDEDQASEGGKEIPAGVQVPPRDHTGTPSDHDEDLTDEAAEAIDTEVATGDSVDERGRPLKTDPPPIGSEH
ncbi:MAG TPA: hypothetical protein VHJ40_08975 [Actinomycetota bacterium]|jgi:hypothetical protein|nr:hypothetical protein [Actinomycetota bacterium]